MPAARVNRRSTSAVNKPNRHQRMPLCSALRAWRSPFYRGSLQRSSKQLESLAQTNPWLGKQPLSTQGRWQPRRCFPPRRLRPCRARRRRGQGSGHARSRGCSVDRTGSWFRLRAAAQAWSGCSRLPTFQWRYRNQGCTVRLPEAAVRFEYLVLEPWRY